MRQNTLVRSPIFCRNTDARLRQRDEFEAQIQWLISSVRQRLAKGCLVLVEGTWFNEHGVLSELSGVADSVTGETFEVLRGCHRSWTQREARHQRE